MSLEKGNSSSNKDKIKSITLKILFSALIIFLSTIAYKTLIPTSINDPIPTMIFKTTVVNVLALALPILIILFIFINEIVSLIEWLKPYLSNFLFPETVILKNIILKILLSIFIGGSAIVLHSLITPNFDNASTLILYSLIPTILTRVVPILIIITLFINEIVLLTNKIKQSVKPIIDSIK